jgi:hypothetical protein
VTSVRVLEKLILFADVGRSVIVTVQTTTVYSIKAAICSTDLAPSRCTVNGEARPPQ